jgi:hypothetical protein
VVTGDDSREAALIQYLLGSASDAETERFDERSIADPAFADRLAAVEHELVDAYVRGELPEDLRGQVEADYSATARGRAKVTFARTLRARELAHAAGGVPRRAAWRVAPLWAAAAAALATAVGGYLLVQQTPAPARTAVAQPQHRDDVALPSAAARATQLPVLSFVLLPARRGAENVPLIRIPAGGAEIRFELMLEDDGFPRYRASLPDPASGRVLWQGAPASATTSAGRRSFAVTFSSRVLGPRVYELQLAGVPQDGEPEPLGSYPFRAVLE